MFLCALFVWMKRDYKSFAWVKMSGRNCGKSKNFWKTSTDQRNWWAWSVTRRTPRTCQLSIVLQLYYDYTNAYDDALSVAVKAGIVKLQKYEAYINDTKLPFICTFLNPALKMNYFKEFYAKNAVRDINTKISPVQSSKRKVNQSDDEDDFYSHMYKRSKRSNEPTEIKNYSDLPLSNPKMDLIEYWKSKQQEYSLSAMARYFLPIQCGSASVERYFSGAVKVVTPYRCRLQVDTIRARMSLKSWNKD